MCETNMIALSTSIFNKYQPLPRNIIQVLEEFQVSNLELGINISDSDIRYLKNILYQNEKIKISSLHNYCPIPPGIKRGFNSGDLFSLSSLEKSESEKAIEHTLKTIEMAASLNSKFVVIHSGFVTIADRYRKSQKEIFSVSTKNKIIELREKHISQHLEAVERNLQVILKHSQHTGIKIGLENRFHIEQIPTFEEASFLINELKSDRVGIWLDTGHLMVQATKLNFDFYQKVEKFKNKIFGLHLHDFNGTTDHIPVGEGRLDYVRLFETLSQNVSIVLEYSSNLNKNKVIKSIELVKSALNEE
jgi:sugar phosphate isomerase/epimerase